MKNGDCQYLQAQQQGRRNWGFATWNESSKITAHSHSLASLVQGEGK